MLAAAAAECQRAFSRAGQLILETVAGQRQKCAFEARMLE
jgi:hypothetical protein